MANETVTVSRRTFLAASCLAAASPAAVVAAAERSPNKICAFIKFLQSLSYDRLAAEMAELGFDGIEATVRRGGHVLPERVEEDLPRLVEALKQHGLEVTVMASDVTRVDEPHTKKVLETAAALGIERYRMGYYRYDLERPVWTQLQEFKPVVHELAALNAELGLTAVYQNHSGARYVGGSLWDLHHLIRDLPADRVASAFDIRHATAEGGQTWPVSYNLLRPHLGIVYVKDFVWKGRRPENVPLGEGQVAPAFFELLKRDGYAGPISLHVEYLPQAGVEENLAALRRDLNTLRDLLAG